MGKELKAENTGNSYFELQAYMGATKHMGGLNRTKDLINLLKIKPDSYVLDAGCGPGATPIWLARNVGCRVMGIDSSPGMIKRAEERKKRENIEKVEFKKADAGRLPFKKDTFDAVMGESVLLFVEERKKAVKELRRVLKKGGFLGFNEIYAEKGDKKAEEYFKNLFGTGSVPSSEEWTDLLKKAGMKNVRKKEYKMSFRDEFSRMERYGAGELLRSAGRGAELFLKNPGFTGFIKKSMKYPRGVMKKMKNGLYWGRK